MLERLSEFGSTRRLAAFLGHLANANHHRTDITENSEGSVGLFRQINPVLASPFLYLKTLPEITRLAVMTYIRFPLSLRNVEDLLHERGIDICHETLRFW